MPRNRCIRSLALACLLALLISPAVLAQYVPPTPFSRKAEAVEVIESALPTGHNRTDRRLTKAAEKIGATLDLNLWIDDEHLVLETGLEVFRTEKRAVMKLLAVIGDVEAPVVAKELAEDAIIDLIDSDRRLADLARDELIAARAAADCPPELTVPPVAAPAAAPGSVAGDGDGDRDSDSDSDSDSDGIGASGIFAEPDCDCDKSLRKLGGTEEQIGLAGEVFGADDWEAVVIAYKRAWRKASKGRLAVSLCETLPISCPCDGSPLFSPFTDGSAILGLCFWDPGPPDTVIQATQAFSRAEAAIVPEEMVGVCAADELVPRGVNFEIFITEEEAQFCIDRMAATIVEGLGSLDACFGPTAP